MKLNRPNFDVSNAEAVEIGSWLVKVFDAYDEEEQSIKEGKDNQSLPYSGSMSDDLLSFVTISQPKTGKFLAQKPLTDLCEDHEKKFPGIVSGIQGIEPGI